MPSEPRNDLREILAVVRRYWGFVELRPLQEEAIRAGLDRRDSLVVLPTGGGKSLCYQVPPLLAGRTDIVISPLISLMKDQVDGLRADGYPAAALHSAQSPEERSEAENLIASSGCRLAFVSPERIVTPWFLETVERLGVESFAVDEAHCISHWGHDFRPEYRQLAVLKRRFAGASMHAYTATATERVRQDIVDQLGLNNPTVLVGRFDRPNLIYRLIPRLNQRAQVETVLERHRGQAAIVYCISRADTEQLAKHLVKKGHRAAHYHAGIEPSERHRTQEAFSSEKLDIVVATVAFGMGIDRSNVRCVVHAAMPKSVEHYQQETGRAGRDGLEAECVLLHSPADALRWRTVLERSSEDGEVVPEEPLRRQPDRKPVLPRGGDPQLDLRQSSGQDLLDLDKEPDGVSAKLALLDEMRRFCTPATCRHRALSEYFGQAYQPPGARSTASVGAGPAGSEGSSPGPLCGACDVCLGETDGWVDGTEAARMILSCVARLGQPYGMGHVVDVLRGANTERIRGRGHDQLSTWGLMKDRGRKELMYLVFQLLDQQILYRSDGEYPVLLLNPASRQVLVGERTVQVQPVKTARVRTTTAEAESWEGVDRELFEQLRGLRTELARTRQVPPYVIFSDASLRDMARRRPETEAQFLEVHGVGEKKLADFGSTFLTQITKYTIASS